MINSELKQPNPTSKINQDINSNISAKPQLLFQSFQSDLDIQKIIIKCIGLNPSLFVCLNQNCLHSNNPFVCGQLICSCQQSHQQCVKGNISFITKKLKQKICKPSKVKMQIQSIFDSIIDLISDFRDKTILEIDSKLKYINLHQLEKQFMKIIQNQRKKNQGSNFQENNQNIKPQKNSQSIKSSQTQNHTKSQLPNQKDSFNANLSKNMQKLWALISDKTPKRQSPYQLLLQQINILEKKVQQSIKSVNNIINFYSGHSLVNFHFQGSDIIELNRINDLQKLFGKTIKSSQLLYKASANNFSLSKFYQLCSSVPGIMIICQTNKGKIIGGYTPLSFQCQNRGDHYAADTSGQSFIFSLTHNDKFYLKTRGNAIYRVSNKQRICFGGCEFQICDKANIVQKCRSYSINYYYQNENYKQNDKQSFKRFNGNQGQYFTVKQWEAWKVQVSNEKLEE